MRFLENSCAEGLKISKLRWEEGGRELQERGLKFKKKKKRKDKQRWLPHGFNQDSDEFAYQPCRSI